jgi:type II secretory pathway component PulC
MLLIVMLSLAGCMPPFNWREVRFDEQKIAVTFPGKPDTMSRTIDLAGSKLSMTMYGVRVKELSYTVAWVKLPNVAPIASATSASNILAAMQLGMLRNVNAASVDGAVVKAAPSITEAQAPLIDASGKPIGAVLAKKVLVNPTTVSPSSRDSPQALQMNGLFASHAGYAFQVVAVGSAEQFRQSNEATESAKVFLESVRFIQ